MSSSTTMTVAVDFFSNKRYRPRNNGADQVRRQVRVFCILRRFSAIVPKYNIASPENVRVSWRAE